MRHPFFHKISQWILLTVTIDRKGNPNQRQARDTNSHEQSAALVEQTEKNAVDTKRIIVDRRVQSDLGDTVVEARCVLHSRLLHINSGHGFGDIGKE